jgi:hypothetical protein
VLTLFGLATLLISTQKQTPASFTSPHKQINEEKYLQDKTNQNNTNHMPGQFSMQLLLGKSKLSILA